MKKVWTSAALLMGLLLVVGCGAPSTTKPDGDPTNEKAVAKGDPKDKAAPKDEGDHGWWCNEHGVKEEECSMCQKEVFKKLKPDEICPNHPDRAKAQCFICNPELRAKNAAIYKAKYGKEPPPLPPEAKDEKK